MSDLSLLLASKPVHFCGRFLSDVAIKVVDELQLGDEFVSQSSIAIAN
jgi:hypothetical protein